MGMEGAGRREGGRGGEQQATGTGAALVHPFPFPIDVTGQDLEQAGGHH